MSHSISIQCEDVLNIAGVNLLCVDIKAAVSESDDIIFKASNVERVDAASLQLFASLFSDSEKMGITVQWQDPSDALKDSAKILGLADLLKLNN